MVIQKQDLLSLLTLSLAETKYIQSEWPGPETRDPVQGDGSGRCEQTGWIIISTLETANYTFHHTYPLSWLLPARLINPSQVADLRMTPISGRDYDSHRALTVRGRTRYG